MTVRDVAALCRWLEGGAEPEYLCFWGHRAHKDGRIGPSCLSQWWPCDLHVEGEGYRSAEHYMMAEKARLFGDEDTRAQILAAADPGKAKALGRRVAGFEQARWERARFQIVVRGNLAKFGQHERLRYFLLGTRDAVLVEASPTDRVWGIGLAADHPDAKTPSAWPGTNLLGFALMEVRSVLSGRG